MSDDFYTPPSANTNTGQDIVYAGFWRRVFASIIDSIAALIILLPLFFKFFSLDDLENDGIDFSNPTSLLINYVIPIGLTVFFWTVFKATPGKMVLGCQVVNAETGEKLGVGRSIVRYIGYIVSVIPLGLGFLWIVFNKRKRGWHDLMAGTVVIRKSN